jgi:transcriptional regulator with XRE-family HTH domain
MSSPIVYDQEQIQKLTELGTHLRSHRAKKGLSLEEIATKTMIQQRFLEAIEKGQLDRLPEPLYVRGFIRRFAEAMGLDGVSLSESFPMGKAHVGSTNTKMLGTASNVLRPWHLYLLYLAAVLGAVALLYALFKPADSPSGTVGTNRPSPQASVVASKKPAPAAAKPKIAAPVQAQLTLKADSYLDIRKDGQREFEGTLKAGQVRTITAKQSIQISAGNAGGVMLGINGQPAKIMGKPGEVKDASLTPSSR